MVDKNLCTISKHLLSEVVLTDEFLVKKRKKRRRPRSARKKMFSINEISYKRGCTKQSLLYIIQTSFVPYSELSKLTLTYNDFKVQLNSSYKPYAKQFNWPFFVVVFLAITRSACNELNISTITIPPFKSDSVNLCPETGDYSHLCRLGRLSCQVSSFVEKKLHEINT